MSTVTGNYDVISEHEHIRHLVDRLEAWIERRQLNAADWVSELATRLERLNADLCPHFHAEEKVVFQDISGRIPRLATTVARLVEQHRRMEKDFAQIEVGIKNLGTQEPGAAEQFIEQIAKVLRLLKVHEQQEVELILTAYGQDLGEPL
jgi:hemerythrin-like domain-containing protein